MGVLFKNNRSYSGGKLLMSPECYSTEEKEIGVWTDGKPLYQRTFIKDFTSSGTPQTLVDSDIDYAQQVAMTYRQISGSTIIHDSPFYLQSSTCVFCYIDVRNGKMLLYNTYNGSLRWIVTIQYTKLSDTAGSGTWTPSGLPTVKYSTAEQIVGTWADGSAIYEKTWDLGSDTSITGSSYNWSNTPVSTSGLNISRIIDCSIRSNAGYAYYPLGCAADDSYVQILMPYSILCRFITLRYTKTS